MAKPLGPKSLLIRQAIQAHPDKGNTEVAELLMDSADRLDDKLKISAQDVATQRQAMKKAGAAKPAPAADPKAGNGRKKPGKKTGRRSGSRPASTPAALPAAAATTDVVAHVEAIREAVRKLGAEQVRRIVGLFE